MIPFNKPCFIGDELQFIQEAIEEGSLAGNGPFNQKCQEWFENRLSAESCLLTPSCTAALEMAAILIDVQPGDEVIMPSYTFVSTANAFVLRGAKIIFIDIRPDTMNMNETLIEAAITEKTKAIVPVHYAGVACEMDIIMEIANRYGLYVVEDAAQAMMSTYKGMPVGTHGHLAAYSFHETKNYTSGGEGGLLIINDKKFADRAEIIREKGTNRSQFFRGMIDKYSWVDIGSSYLMNDVSAAYLWGQLEHADVINENRLISWNAYYAGLKELEAKGSIKLPNIPDNCTHNGHMFYIKVEDLNVRTKLLGYLVQNNVYATFHYVPLHSAPAGLNFGRFNNIDECTTKESEKL
ncbi:dTDP-4-amino-4,6-dideoxygalactose transaminase, partial [Pseudomonadota bacterium]